LVGIYILASNLDTFKDIWGRDIADVIPETPTLFRYLQGYMGTVEGFHCTSVLISFRYLQGYMGTTIQYRRRQDELDLDTFKDIWGLTGLS